MKKDVISLVRPNIASLEPYSTARDEYKGELGVLLDANENPFAGKGINRYPSTSVKEALRSRISRIKGVPSGNIFLGNGSDEAIDLCYRIFCRPGIDNAVSISPSYGMYGVCADVNDVEFRPVLLGEDFSLPADEIIAACDSRTRLVFICSPNNPTANAFPLESILKVVDSVEAVVVVDEAYVDFSSAGSLLPVLGSHRNLIILQTLSKAYGLAGLRVGLAFACEDVIRIFRQVKYPYNIGTDTLELAIRCLDGSNALSEIETLVAERNRLEEILREEKCILKVYPSDANFLLVKVMDPAGVYKELLGAGVIVRDRSRVPLCGGCLRLTVGTHEENEKLIEVIRAYGK